MLAALHLLCRPQGHQRCVPKALPGMRLWASGSHLLGFPSQFFPGTMKLSFSDRGQIPAMSPCSLNTRHTRQLSVSKQASCWSPPLWRTDEAGIYDLWILSTPRLQSAVWGLAGRWQEVTRSVPELSGGTSGHANVPGQGWAGGSDRRSRCQGELEGLRSQPGSDTRLE